MARRVRRWPRRAGATFEVLAALFFASAVARAEGSDGMYGRLDGDATFRAAAGAAVGRGEPDAVVELGLSYLRTAGAWARWADGLGGDGPFERSVGIGAELAPLFLARMASDLEQGPAVLDLAIDSLALGVGAFWRSDARSGWSAEPGLEVTLSLDVPLFGDATGPFAGVRGSLRWRPEDLAGKAEGDLLDAGSTIVFVLGYGAVFDLGLVDAGDAVAR